MVGVVGWVIEGWGGGGRVGVDGVGVVGGWWGGVVGWGMVVGRGGRVGG